MGERRRRDGRAPRRDDRARDGVDLPLARLGPLLLVLGADADRSTPWVADVLGDRDLAAVGKVRKLARLAREQAVEGIEDVLVVKEVCEE